MKILISTLGSRGDTQPYLALAVGLQQAGHSVTLVAPDHYGEWIQSYGVQAHTVPFNPHKVMRSITKSKNPLQALHAMRGVMKTDAMEAMEDCWQAAQETDFLIQTGTGNNALEIARVRGIPVAFSYLMPMQPTHAFPMFMLPVRFSLGRGYNYLTHKLFRWVLWSSMGGPATNQWRAQLSLPKWRSETEMLNFARSLDTPSLYGYSPSVLPKPTDWDANQHVTGYWFLDAPPDWQPPRDLSHFLENGAPPVYIGFGSMIHENPEHQTSLALRALELSGQRGILLLGSGDFIKISGSPNVFCIADVPHSWLFPRMATVVHHGGAGTTAAGLRAGVPTTITPFGGDQFAWGHRVQQMKVGLCTSNNKKLTVETLANAIQTAVFDSDLRTHAARLGEKIRNEFGISRAIEIIENHAVRFNQRLSEVHGPDKEDR